MRVELDCRPDQVAKHDVVGELTCTSAGLHDDWAVGSIRGLHDRQHLFHIVHIEGGYAIRMLSSMIEQLAKGYESHVFY